MTPEQLKTSILYSALKGQLTEQLIGKEDAKKDYPNIKVSTAEDIPYDLPENWLWVDLREVATNQNGYAFKPSDWLQSGTKIIRIQNLTDDKVPCNYCDESVVEDKYRIKNGDVLVSWSCTIDAFLYEGEDAVLNQHIFKIIFDKISIEKKFYIYAIKSLLSTINDRRHGSTMTHITKKDFESLYFPLPPLEEQKRIVAKIEELLPYVDRYAESYEKLEQFNAKFPEDMKKSILQYAIQGKLVEQRPEEGSAEELYQQIQEEKQRLIKEGKIKKEKPLAEISEDEIPFDIPDTWKWVRVCSVGVTQTGNTPQKSHPEYFGNYIPFLGPGDIQNGNVNYDNQGLSEEGKEYGRVTPSDSVLQVCIGGSIGKCALVDREVTFNQQINSIYPLIADSKYVYYVLDSYYFKDYMKENSGGTATPIINRGLWDAIVIPLPPLEEQQRIVAKIEEILPLCDRLTN